MDIEDSAALTAERNVELTVEIVSAYVTNNSVPASDLPKLIADVHSALERVQAGESEPVEEAPKPAVSIRKSINRDYLICLEDGLKFKSLRRHLATKFNMTPDEYRQKWNLPADYPMVAPSYAEARSALAKSMGLGRKPGQGRRGRKKAA